MYLKNLEISGFKSFAKKGSLEFKTPISAIVGPNGSGKSNIAEAFRFVLGEQSMKTLRSKRGEDLIFSGSREEKTMNRAGVKVVFDNSSRFLDIDYDEVIIKRVVHRDGVNQYFINKSQVRLKDVSELLAGANIGSSGHHIISQGEADRILSVNSKDRRGMIEEALGLRIYQFKISESEKKLIKVDENIKDVRSLRREIAPHLKFLKKQVKKIEQSVELKEKLVNLYKEYFKREDEYLKYQKKYIKDNKKPLNDQIIKLEDELKTAQSILDKEKEISEHVENKKLTELESKLKEIQVEKNDLERKIGQIEGMIAFEERRLKTEEEKQNQEEERVIKLKKVKSFINDINAQLSRYDDKVVGKDLVEKIRKVVIDFIDRNFQGEQKIKIDKSELVRLGKEKENLNKKMAIIVEKEKDIVFECERLEKEIETEKESSHRAEVKIFEIKAKQSEIFAKLNSLKDLESRIEIEDENYKKELSESFILAGREATQFFDLEISVNEIINGNRSEQEERRRKIEKIKIKLEDMGGGSGEDIVKEYEEVQDRDNFLKREIEDLEISEISLKKLIAELKEKLDTEFKEGIEKINNQFNEFFATMFGGGKAELLLVKPKKRKRTVNDLEAELPSGNEEDEKVQDGIEVNVALPNKKTKGLQMLSGGERSLTSIALLFAMSQINPPPFIILDETDAALDEANSRRYGDMIENLSEYSQLILITHNRETMSRAGVLYGITMGMNGVSKLLSVKLDEAVKVAK